MSTSVVIPTIIWYEPPSHTISSFLLLYEKRTVVTGSNSGHICFWDIKENGKKSIEPRIFVTNQDPSPVVALINAQFEWKDCIISVTMDGSVGIFNLADGQCLSSSRGLLKCEPTCVELLGDRYLAAGGRSSDLEIMDFVTRKPIRRVDGHLTWIRDMITCNFSNDCPVLVTLTGSGIIKFWTKADLLTKTRRLVGNEEQSNVVFPISQLNLELQDTKMIKVSSDSILLVVSQTKWMLYTLGKKLLMENTLPQNTLAISGDFIDDWVVIWSKDGVGYVFSLKTVKEFLADKSNLKEAEECYLEDQNHANKVALLNSVEHMCTFRIKVEDKQLNHVSNFKAKVSGNIITASFGQGFLCVWDDYKIEEGVEEIYPNFFGTISSGWPKKSIVSVSASYVIEDLLLLINGYEDGTLSITNLPYDDDIKKWKAHDAKVNCVLHIKGLSGSDYIISGSDDSYVKVWKLSDQTLVGRYSNHSGHVKKLFNICKSDAEKYSKIWQQRFFSLGDDNVVILHQLENDPGVKCVYGPHPSEIADVSWNLGQDYLIIGCEDGSVSIWEMESGELEQSLYGKTALDIFANANPLAKMEKQEIVKLISNKAITGISLDGSSVGCRNRSPIQAIVFNMRELTNSISPFMQENPNNNDILKSVATTMKVYSYIFPWGYNKELDLAAVTELNIKQPDPSVCFGLMGSSGRISIVVPNASPNTRWTRSDTFTALHSLSIASLSKSLLTYRNNANTCSQVLAHVNTIMPEQTKNYANPSLSFLARYWQDKSEDVMQCARSIFISAIDRYDLPSLQHLAQYWASLLENTEESESNRKTKALAVLVLGILGSERPESLTAVISNQVTIAIMDLIFQEKTEKLRIAAVELLGKGFAEWSKHIQDNVSQVIKKLFKLSTLTEPKKLTDTAHRALLLIGAKEPVIFLRAIGNHFQQRGSKGNAEINPDEYSKALNAIRELVKKHPASLLGAMHILVETVVASLDPHVPHLRNACLKSTTSLVHDLVRKYPMIAFHQATQRLAVGTKEGTIFIYDLISATRWFKLDGHKGEVSAVAFENDGHYLSSYSIQESLVKIWKTPTTFLGILGSNPSMHKSIPVSRTTKTITAEALLEMAVRLQWTSAKTFILVRTWEEQGQNFLELSR